MYAGLNGKPCVHVNDGTAGTIGFTGSTLLAVGDDAGAFACRNRELVYNPPARSILYSIYTAAPAPCRGLLFHRLASPSKFGPTSRFVTA